VIGLASNTSRAELRSARFSIEQAWRRWLLLVPVLVIALLVRWHYAPDPAYSGDLTHFARWIQVLDTNGAFGFYNSDLRLGAWDRTYPPLATLSFEAVRFAYGGAPLSERLALHDPYFVILLKLLPVLSELTLIIVVYAWLIERPVLRTIIPAALAVSPGLVATSAWWGQYDAPFTLFVVLALFALNRDRVLLAWLSFAVALLLKQPAVVIAPVLLVLSFRRYGWRATLAGIAICAAVGALATLPFLLTSGVDALSPYLKMNGAFPYLSNNAYNFWYALASIHKGSVVQFLEYPDSGIVLGGIAFQDAGMFLFAVFALLVTVVMWRRYREKQELVWAAVLYMGFFMLPTQVHERYLYPAAVLMLIAAAQDARFIVPAAGVAVTLAYNVLGVLIPHRSPEHTFSVELLAFSTALLNLTLFAVVVWYLIKPDQPDVESAAHRE
jgi:Gpi18-like mannosyltransferase